MLWGWGGFPGEVMGVDAPPDGIEKSAKMAVFKEPPSEEETSVSKVSIIGIDLAKRSFQLHGAGADGSVIFRKKLSRARMLDFLAQVPPSLVAMESCASAHYWGREIAKLSHEVRLIPPECM